MKSLNCSNTKENKSNSDFYQTHYSITEQLLEVEEFDYDKTILEPACGKLAIVKILEKCFKKVVKSDIQLGINFLDFYKFTKQIGYIITNPPFSLSFEFIQKAKEIATEKFAMLLPLNYLHGQKRYEEKIFRDEKYPLTKVYIFTRYPLLTDEIRDDGKYKTGMIAYAWYVWEKNSKHIIDDVDQDDFLLDYIPVINWIDNNKYIINSKYEKKDYNENKDLF